MLQRSLRKSGKQLPFGVYATAASWIQSPEATANSLVMPSQRSKWQPCTSTYGQRLFFNQSEDYQHAGSMFENPFSKSHCKIFAHFPLLHEMGFGLEVDLVVQDALPNLILIDADKLRQFAIDFRDMKTALHIESCKIKPYWRNLFRAFRSSEPDPVIFVENWFAKHKRGREMRAISAQTPGDEDVTQPGDADVTQMKKVANSRRSFKVIRDKSEKKSSAPLSSLEADIQAKSTATRIRNPEKQRINVMEADLVDKKDELFALEEQLEFDDEATGKYPKTIEYIRHTVHRVPQRDSFLRAVVKASNISEVSDERIPTMLNDIQRRCQPKWGRLNLTSYIRKPNAALTRCSYEPAPDTSATQNEVTREVQAFPASTTQMEETAKKRFTLLSWNVNGLTTSSRQSTQTKLKAIFSTNPDIIALQEVHSPDINAYNAFTQNGYTLVSQDLRVSASGGVAIWAKKGHSSRKILLKRPQLSVRCEIAAALVTDPSTNSTLSLATWYVTPSNTIGVELHDNDANALVMYIENTLEPSGIQLLVGDPNARHTHWCPGSRSRSPSGSTQARGNQLYQLTTESNWKVDNFGATYRARFGYSTGTCPDLVMCHRPMKALVKVLHSFPSNDHLPHWMELGEGLILEPRSEEVAMSKSSETGPLLHRRRPQRLVPKRVRDDGVSAGLIVSTARRQPMVAGPTDSLDSLGAPDTHDSSLPTNPVKVAVKAPINKERLKAIELATKGYNLYIGCTEANILKLLEDLRQELEQKFHLRIALSLDEAARRPLFYDVVIDKAEKVRDEPSLILLDEQMRMRLNHSPLKFGGVQIILVGSSPGIISSKLLRNTFVMCALTEEGDEPIPQHRSDRPLPYNEHLPPSDCWPSNSTARDTSPVELPTPLVAERKISDWRFPASWKRSLSPSATKRYKWKAAAYRAEAVRRTLSLQLALHSHPPTARIYSSF